MSGGTDTPVEKNRFSGTGPNRVGNGHSRRIAHPRAPRCPGRTDREGTA
nr:MAG TPA: hypothetical protein [Caudoviricetes sp.]